MPIALESILPILDTQEYKVHLAYGRERVVDRWMFLSGIEASGSFETDGNTGEIASIFHTTFH
jgi:hypothetical protein